MYEKHAKDYGSGIGLEVGSSWIKRPKKYRNKNVRNVSVVQQDTLQADQNLALLTRQMMQQKISEINSKEAKREAIDETIEAMEKNSACKLKFFSSFTPFIQPFNSYLQQHPQPIVTPH